MNFCSLMIYIRFGLYSLHLFLQDYYFILFFFIFYLSFFCFFFFFQAEDGIRDLTVTGVQTCALPISTTIGEQIVQPLFPLVWEAFVDFRLEATYLTRLDRGVIQRLVARLAQQRSEERRVGKECRSRWSPEH